LRREGDLDRAVEGIRGVVHAAGWVSLGRDDQGESWAVNVDATEALLDFCVRAGVERFVYTSTLWTVAAGSSERPADEAAGWNLMSIRSPYSESKREAESRVLARNGNGLLTTVICPGLVIGPGDVRPTSTGLLLQMSRFSVVLVPSGGIPVVDARVVARAHVQALERAEPGRRYVVAGPYLSYPELALLVARVAGRPRWIVVIPDFCEAPLAGLAEIVGSLFRRRLTDVSAAAVAGGFLHLHATGARADAAFGLRHPPPEHSIFEALDDFRRSGRAPWLGSLRTFGVAAATPP
jgi:dihydroflavonol-4-reductase